LIVAWLVVSAFAALRVYAIWNQDWRPAIPVLCLALVPVITNLYIEAKTVPTIAPPPSAGCALELRGISLAAYSDITGILNGAATTACDGLVVLFTLARTLGVRNATRAFNVKPGLSSVILRDGTAYFLLLLLLNIIQIVVAVTDVGENAIAYFVSPLTSILISRFLLNLREVSYSAQDLRTAEPSLILTSHLSDIHFASNVVGNLGAPLRHGHRQNTSVDGDSYADFEWEDSQRGTEVPALMAETCLADFMPAGHVEIVEVPR